MTVKQRQRNLVEKLMRASSRIKATIDLDELRRMVYQIKIDASFVQQEVGTKSFLEVVFFALLRRKTLPSLATVRFACRLVRQNKEFCYCEPILQAISNAEDLHTELLALSQAIRNSRARRNELKVESTVYKKALRQYLASVCFPFNVPSIDFAHPDEGFGAARTNGKRIFLPYRVDAADEATQGVLINESVLFYLAFHEMQHWGLFGGRSSFEFSFDTTLGKQLLREIKPNLEVIRQHCYGRERRNIYRTILQEENLELPLQNPPPLTHLEVITLASKTPKLFHWFYNAFEDVRIHRQAIDVGMGELRMITGRLVHRYRRHPAFDSPLDKLFEHIIAGVLSQPSTGVAASGTYRTESRVIGQWIREMHDRPFELQSPELSASYAWKSVQLILSKHAAGHGGANHGIALLDERVPIENPVAILLRWQLTRSQWLGHDDRPGNSALKPRRERPRPGAKFDEYDIAMERMLPDAVTIEAGRFRPTRAPLPSYALAGYREVVSRRQQGRGGVMFGSQQLDFHGDEIAMEYGSELLAEMHATGNGIGRHYWNQLTLAPRTSMSILIDLSVSMEQLRRDLPAAPIQMAIAATRLLRDEAVRANVDLEIWGIIDGGRQPVSMLRIDESDIGRIHPIGAGGARFGAGIRFLSQRRARTAQQHLIICMTDGAGTYAIEGSDHLFRLVRRTRCHACQLRLPGHRGCSIERNERVDVGRSRSLFRNAEYQYADIGHAIDNAPANTMVRYIEFAQDPYDAILNRFMAGHWTTCTGFFAAEPESMQRSYR